MGFEKEIQHAKFRLPKPQVHASHPFRNHDNHEALLDYVTARLDGDKTNRDSRVAKYAQTDRDVAAWIRLSEEDQKRQAKHARDGTPVSHEVSLPLTWVHIDDMMTYYAQTFAPNRGMFYHTAEPDQTTEAAQLVSIMNNHAIYGSYYRHLLRAIFNLMKYNVGGVIPEWAIEYGPKLVMNEQEQAAVTSQVVFAGNKIQAIDMYNLFYDPAVEASCLYKDGEWFGLAEMKSHYWLKSKCLEGVYFNCEDILDGESNNFTSEYYKDPPVEAKLEFAGDGSGSRVNWFQYMAGSDGYLVNNAFELVTVYIRINPNDFGLVDGNRDAKAARNRYEVWKVTICNGEKIIGCQYMNNIHNYLPAMIGVIHDDFMRDATKAPAEILNPLQQFSSFLLNAHVKATRKNIFGTTYYDPSCIDMDKIPEGEVAARVPIKAQGWGKDIRQMVQRDDHVLDTKQTLSDLESMLGIIDQFFPTQSLPSQIAGIDRAVDSQVAAVQQGSNRRQHKGARLIDDTMMRPLRFALYYNIVQYLPDGQNIADYFSGKQQKVDLTALRDTSLVHLIGQGLKAIDRQQVATQMQQIIFALIQAPAVAERIDLLAMLDHWTSMMDIDTNMKQFELPPQPVVDPNATPGAAGAAPITPATNPESITAPIYG